MQHTVARYMKQLPGILPLREAWAPRKAIRCCKGDAVVEQGLGSFDTRCVHSTEAVSRVVSMAVSIGGITHLRNRLNEAPSEITRMEKAG